MPGLAGQAKAQPGQRRTSRSKRNEVELLTKSNKLFPPHGRLEGLIMSSRARSTRALAPGKLAPPFVIAIAAEGRDRPIGFVGMRACMIHPCSKWRSFVEPLDLSSSSSSFQLFFGLI